MTGWARRLLPWLLAGACGAIALSRLVLPGDLYGAASSGVVIGLRTGGFALTGVSYAFVAGLILRRHPRHSVGWLLAWFAVAFSVGIVLEEYGAAAGAPGAEWAWTFSGIAWFGGILPLVCLIPLLFPTGVPPTRGWRWFGYATVAGVVVLFGTNLVDPALNSPRGLPNPLAVEAMAAWIEPLIGLGVLLVVSGAVGGVAGAIRRTRRSVGIERQQLKWFGYGSLMTLLSVIALGILYETGHGDMGAAVFAVGSLALPTSIGVAILRYRLYDIDRIVSRTLSYAVVTLVLAGIYVAGVLGVGRFVLRLTGGGSELVVAASTLAVAAAFRPVRARVQAAVDRRFNRARYDAARTVADFAQRLRDEVDLSTLVADLGSTVRETVGPKHASVWIPPTRGAS